MQNTTESIFLGVIAGLLTSTTLLVAKSIFLNTLLPLYRQFMYRGVHIDGTWYHVNSTQKLMLELKQNCEKLSGKATLQWASEENHFHIDSIRTFDVTGQIETRFITLTFRHTDRSRLGIITCLLQIDGDGTILSGQRCWYAPLVSKINSGDIRIYRNEQRAIDAVPKPSTFQTQQEAGYLDDITEYYENTDDLDESHITLEDTSETEIYEETEKTR